jgi:hypothetical protein
MSNHQAASSRSRHRTLTRVLAIAAAPLLLASASGCNRKDPQKCEQAQSVTRQAIQAEDFALAAQWRDYAYKQCDEAAGLQNLDQEIVRAQSSIEQRKVEEESRKRETEQLMKVFLEWVGANRKSVERASASVQCEGEASATPQKPAEQWCTATRSISNKYTISVRYWDAARDAFLFKAEPPNSVDCAALGAHNVVRTWQVPATQGRTAKRTHCELTGGPLSGLHAVVTEAHSAPVWVFSPKYLEKDGVMRQRVQGS